MCLYQITDADGVAHRNGFGIDMPQDACHRRRVFLNNISTFRSKALRPRFYALFFITIFARSRRFGTSCLFVQTKDLIGFLLFSHTPRVERRSRLQDKEKRIDGIVAASLFFDHTERRSSAHSYIPFKCFESVSSDKKLAPKLMSVLVITNERNGERERWQQFSFIICRIPDNLDGVPTW